MTVVIAVACVCDVSVGVCVQQEQGTASTGTRYGYVCAMPSHVVCVGNWRVPKVAYWRSFTASARSMHHLLVKSSAAQQHHPPTATFGPVAQLAMRPHLKTRQHMNQQEQRQILTLRHLQLQLKAPAAPAAARCHPLLPLLCLATMLLLAGSSWGWMSAAERLQRHIHTHTWGAQKVGKSWHQRQRQVKHQASHQSRTCVR